MTDDWGAGAHLMGLSASFVRKNLQANVRKAHVIAAASPSLADSAAHSFGVLVQVLPNGCGGGTSGTPDAKGQSRVAGLAGNLNERLDLEILEALVEAGVPLEIIGPITARHPEVVSRLKTIFDAESVTWTGPLAENEMNARMRNWCVGLTPYRLTDFNFSSFPLKTLDYLAAGLPVVSTDLPASRWLRCPEVCIASSRFAYVSEVAAALEREWTVEAALERQSFAAGHTWDSRADQLLALCQGGEG